MIKNLYYLLFIALSNFIYPAEVNDLDSFFKELKDLNYHDARLLANEVKNTDLQNQMYQLVEVLFHSGQKEVLITKPESNDDLVQAIENLKIGYHHLYTSSYSSNPLEQFQKVYTYSNVKANIELKKFALLSILEVYRNGVEQANDDMLEYLDRFGKLEMDDSDRYHRMIHVLQYNLRDIFKHITVDDAFFREFDLLMNGFDKDHPFWANYLSSKGVYLETLKKYDLAEASHKMAIARIKDQPYLKYIKFRSLIRLSEIYRSKKKSKIALNLVDSAAKYVDLSDTTKYSYYVNLYKSKNYDALGENKEAYQTLKEAYRLKVFLDYDSNNKDISRLNAKYQTAEKENQILVEQKKKEQNRNIAVGLAGLLIFGSLIFFLIQKNTSKKRKLAEQQEQIQIQKVATLLKEQELASIDAMIEGQEKERQKVANELHDDLGSLMATVKLHFDNVKVDKKDQALTNAQKLLDEAYQKIRGMAHSKNSGVMASQGLLPAVEKMAKTINETSALEVTVEDFGLGERMENSLELTIFRIIQELTANIIKHSGADKANIQFTQHEENLNIIVEDNGKGFDMSVIQRNKNGMGLGTIEKRIEHLEGSFTVDSVLGKGTSILIDIPV